MRALSSSIRAFAFALSMSLFVAAHSPHDTRHVFQSCLYYTKSAAPDLRHQLTMHEGEVCARPTALAVPPHPPRGQTPRMPLFYWLSPPLLLSRRPFRRLREPPAVRRVAKFAHLPRRDAPRPEPVTQRKRRRSHERKAPEYLPRPYLRHPPHQPPLGDRPRESAVGRGYPAPGVVRRVKWYNPSLPLC